MVAVAASARGSSGLRCLHRSRDAARIRHRSRRGRVRRPLQHPAPHALEIGRMHRAVDPAARQGGCAGDLVQRRNRQDRVQRQNLLSRALCRYAQDVHIQQTRGFDPGHRHRKTGQSGGHNECPRAIHLMNHGGHGGKTGTKGEEDSEDILGGDQRRHSR